MNVQRIYTWLLNIAALPFYVVDKALDVWGDDDE